MFFREGAFGVVLVVVDLVELFAQAQLRCARIGRRLYMYENGRAHGIATLGIHPECVEQHIAFLIERDLRLPVFIRQCAGAAVDIGCLGILRCL